MKIGCESIPATFTPSTGRSHGRATITRSSSSEHGVASTRQHHLGIELFVALTLRQWRYWLTPLLAVDKEEIDRLRKRFMKLDKVRDERARPASQHSH